MMKPKLLIFDLDGTLIDSRQDVTLAFNRLLEHRGIPAVAPEVIAAYIGTGVRPLLQQIAVEHGIADMKPLIAEFDEIYAGCLLTNTALYPGMSEVLSRYQLTSKIILTNKFQRFVDPILSGLGISHCFEHAFGRDAFPFMKPDPRTVLLACQKFSVDPKEALIIGDTPTDVLAAKNSGAQSCAVTYGYGRQDELINLEPDFMVDHPLQILELFNK